MAKKKSNPPKNVDEPMMEKIAGKLGHLTGEMIVAKDNLVDMATGAIDTVKEKIQQITDKKPAAEKAVKATVKKAEKAFAKKIAPAKKTVKKVVKATIKKAEKKAAPVKKAAPAKKAIKKAAKKASSKK